MYAMVAQFGVLMGLLRVGAGTVSDSFICFEPLFLLLGCLDKKVCASLYCNLLCCVQLISLGSLLFSKGKRRNGFGRKGRFGEEMGEWQKNCIWDIIYNRRIDF